MDSTSILSQPPQLPPSPWIPPSLQPQADGYSPTFQGQRQDLLNQPSGQSTWKVGEYPSTRLLSEPIEVQQAERRLRFARHDTARRIMYGYPAFKCMRRTIADNGQVTISVVEGKARWGGYGHCNNRGCPYCALKLAQKDRNEAERYAAGWVKRGSSIAMVALTMAHTVDEDLATTWEAHTRVLESLHKGRPWRAFKEKYHLGEHFYGNEITDGKNGWHKHQHRCYELMPQPMLTTQGGRRLLASQMQEDLWELYQVALSKHKRSASHAHGLKITVAAGSDSSAESAAKYVTKLSAETMCGGLKSGKMGNQTPWELLDDVTDKRLSEKQRQRASARYHEFALQCKHRHWTYFSEAHVAEGVGTAEEIEPVVAAEPEVAVERQELVVHDLQRRMLEFAKKQAYLLDMAENEGLAACARYIDEFCCPRNWSKQFIRGQAAASDAPQQPVQPPPPIPSNNPQFGEVIPKPVPPTPEELAARGSPWPQPQSHTYLWYDPALG